MGDRELFEKLKKLLADFCPPMEARDAGKEKMDLYSTKPVSFAGRDWKEMYFAGVALQKSQVSLYFFPVYTHPELVEKIPGSLRGNLKGKSCFNFKKTDPVNIGDVKKLLKTGMRHYKKEKLI